MHILLQVKTTNVTMYSKNIRKLPNSTGLLCLQKYLVYIHTSNNIL
jgi:hypothetical protein